VHRPGANPTDLRMDDVLCDFCEAAWTQERPMVEGHRGSCICHACLAVAYAELTPQPSRVDAGQGPCTMCLEDRPEPHWTSPARDAARICRRCARMAAVVLERDPDAGWSRPTA
jgi:hypothetical protein